MPVLDGVTSIRVGADAVDRVYVGSTLIWSRSVGGALSVKTTDTASSVDTARISNALISDADVATSVEAESVDQAGQTISTPDTAATVEGALVDVRVADADVATSVEAEVRSTQDQAKTDADTSGGVVEGQAVTATRTDADTASTVEGQTVTQLASAIVERTVRLNEVSTGTTLTGDSSTAQNGDLMICVACAVGSTLSISSGWTPLFTPMFFGGPANGFGAWYRFKTGQAADTPTITHGTSDQATVIVAPYGGVSSINPFDVTTEPTESGSTVTSIDLDGVTTVTANALVVTAAAVDGSSQTRVMSVESPYVIKAQTTGTGRRTALATAVRATPAATGLVTWTRADTLPLEMAGFVTALRPA